MIQFNYTGEPYPSLEEKNNAKALFLEKLGPFKDEFDQKNGIVTFDYQYPETDERRISFVLGPNHSLSDFIIRWNEYIGTIEDNPV